MDVSRHRTIDAFAAWNLSKVGAARLDSVPNKEKRVLQSKSTAAAALRTTIPGGRLYTAIASNVAIQDLCVDECRRIIDAWRSRRLISTPRASGGSVPEVSEKTKQVYQRHVEMLLEECRRALMLPEGAPIDAVEVALALFRRASCLKPSSFRAYRAALLHEYDHALAQAEAAQLAANQLVRALASVIVAEQQLASTMSQAGAQRRCKARPERLKWTKIEVFENVINSLMAGPDARRLAGLALRCTLETGLRPIEWFSASIRPASAEDFPPRFDVIDGAIVLSTSTAKRRFEEQLATRQLVIFPGPLQERVLQFVGDLKCRAISYRNARSMRSIRDAQDAVIKSLTGSIHRVARKSYPNEPRHICLYSARSQAKANFAARWGNVLASIAFGHQADGVGKSSYPSQARAHGRTRGASPLMQRDTDCIIPHSSLFELAFGDRDALGDDDVCEERSVYLRP